MAESEISYELNGVPVHLKSKTQINFSFVGSIQTTGEEKPTNWLFIYTPQLLIKVKEFTSVTPVRQGVYSGKTFDGDGNVKGVELSYSDLSNKFYESSYVDPNTEVIIQDISRSGVSGPFRGRVINNSDTLKFENGKFSIYTYRH